MAKKITYTQSEVKRIVDDSVENDLISGEARDIIIDSEAATQGQVIDEDLASQDRIFIAIMPDDSASVEAYGNEGKVIYCHNRAIDALNELKTTSRKKWSSILLLTEYLNGNIINDWVGLDQAERLIGRESISEKDNDIKQELVENGWISDYKQNYRADKGTPLYDRTVELICGVIIHQELISNFNNRKSQVGILIISDGEDVNSKKQSAADVQTMINTLKKQSNPLKKNIVAFMGLPGQSPEFYIDIAHQMGIEDEVEKGESGPMVSRILTPKASLKDIRNAIDIFSTSVTALNLR